jgi:hypothetical protein
MKALSIVLLLLVSMVAGSVVVYKKVNEDGSVTYSDVPSDGAKQLVLTQHNTAVMPSSQTSPASNKQLKLPAPTKRSIIVKSYSIRILSPTPGQTIRSNNGVLDIETKLAPEVAGRYELLLNDTLHTSQGSPKFHLENISRGEHRFQVRFVDNSGKILALTPMQTVFLHRASALINAN